MSESLSSDHIEEMIIGILLYEPQRIPTVQDIITTPNVFYYDRFRCCYQAIINLHDNDKQVSIVTIYEELKRIDKVEEVGGLMEIEALTDNVWNSAQISDLCYSLCEYYLRREMLKLSSQLTSESTDNTVDVFDLKDNVQQQIIDLYKFVDKSSLRTGVQLITTVTNELERRCNSDNSLNGYSCGLTDVDNVQHGLTDTNLIILAARPGMGKTSYALMNTFQMLEQGARGLFFSLEMSAVQLIQRLLSMHGEIDNDRFQRANLQDSDWVKYNNAVSYLESYLSNLIIDDQGGLNIQQLRSRAKNEHSKQPLDFIIIDYLQLLSGLQNKKQQNREQEISEISRSLKQLAKELNVPIIALSQLSRAVETRGGFKEPMLSDLRESGSIEQDADQVLFLYRPSYYNIDEYMYKGEACAVTGNDAYVIIAKNRQGSVSKVRVNWEGRYTKFSNEHYESEVWF